MWPSPLLSNAALHFLELIQRGLERRVSEASTREEPARAGRYQTLAGKHYLATICT